MQYKKNKSASPYHAIDLAVLWFINTIGCRRCSALICLMSDPLQHNGLYCCDNCIYDGGINENGSQIPTFERHDVTTRHFRRYLKINEYQRRTLESSRDELVQRGKRSNTSMEDQEASLAALSDFADETWQNGMGEIMFCSTFRQKIAGAAAWIASIKDLLEVLRPTCNFETSCLKLQAVKILDIVASTFTTA